MHKINSSLSMFLFDNILFASFIPQILMFLGFISCISAQLFSSEKPDKQEFTPAIETLTNAEKSNQSQSIAYFYHYNEIQENTILTKIPDKLFLKEGPVVDFPKLTYLFRSIDPSFSIFSRPPPFFFFQHIG